MNAAHEPQLDHEPAAPSSVALPLVALLARPALALAAQSGTALRLRARHQPEPFRRAAGWWMVYSTAVDAGCAVLLAAAARREGVSLRSAAGLEARPARRLRAAALDAAALVPAAVLSQLLSRPLSSDPTDPYPPQIRVSQLHGAARVYSLTLWPALWALGEEVTYLGYALPRLEHRLGRGPAAALVALAWAAQHAVMPALPGRRYALMRVLTMLPVSAAFTGVYLLRGRRLPPLIAAHWASDASTAGLAAALAAGALTTDASPAP
ncbi:MAG TPA: CPBP family glutamic-type intramembrane protease [Thermoleophilia bacterium]|nr:CPBP family glutamic-type intramembrane protease [Thermoleophilia bacterium]